MTEQPGKTIDPATAEPHAPAPAAPPSTARTLRELGPAGILGILWLAMPPLGFALMAVNAPAISAWLKSHGDARAVAIYIACFIVLAGFGLLPTVTQALLAGYAFGVYIGFPAALAGFVGASIVGYTIARTVTQSRVERAIKEHPKAEVVRRALLAQSWRRTFLIVTLIRIPPNSPFAMTNLLLAGVKVPPAIFLGATLVGMAPRTLAAVYIGSQIKTFTGKEAPPAWVFISGIVLTLIVFAVIGTIANKALKRVSAGPGSVPPIPDGT